MTPTRRNCRFPRRQGRLAVSTAVATAALGLSVQSALAQQRALGLDVSAWQGDISQSTWNNIHNVENR